MIVIPAVVMLLELEAPNLHLEESVIIECNDAYEWILYNLSSAVQVAIFSDFRKKMRKIRVAVKRYSVKSSSCK